MPERDYVTEPFKVTFSGTVPFDTLYKTIHKWFTQTYKYDSFDEKEHKTLKTPQGKNLFFKWQSKRIMTDYIIYVIDLEVVIKNMVEVKRKESNEKCYKGDYTFTFSGFIMKDYEDTWSRYAFVKFMREVYDKFLIGSKMIGFEKELLSDMNKLRAELKAFLNLQKTG